MFKLPEPPEDSLLLTADDERLEIFIGLEDLSLTVELMLAPSLEEILLTTLLDKEAEEFIAELATELEDELFMDKAVELLDEELLIYETLDEISEALLDERVIELLDKLLLEPVQEAEEDKGAASDRSPLAGC